MKFNLIDKIELITDERIVAVKYVSRAEEYLADHFPSFEVLPGVMMLEAFVQAAGWVMHHRNHFSCSMAVLKEARNVRYGHFVAPGNFLKVEVTLTKQTETGAVFNAVGSIGTSQALSGKIEIAYFNLGDRQPNLRILDAKLREHTKSRWASLSRGLKLDGSAAAAGPVMIG